jgi:sulfur carrier protein
MVDARMTITVNGKMMGGVEGFTIDELLRQLNVPKDFTAVSLNGEVIPKQSYATTSLHDHDKVEIVRPVGGG